ncbi:4Fe-4S dicluster domain-containing protein [Chloroflexota bacterium]
MASDSEEIATKRVTIEHSHLIPASAKLEVWKRDKGRCALCGSTDDLHFEHIIMQCRHCSKPACVKACPEDAIIQRADGIVLYIGERCSSCLICTEACPYGAISYNPYSKDGSALVAENIQLLCARHNLAKRDKIE